MIDSLFARATDAVVVGVGNVALDVARVLIKSADQLADTDMADEVLESLVPQADHRRAHPRPARPRVHHFTTKELRELGQLDGVEVIVNAADLELDASSQARLEQDRVAARNVTVLRDWAARAPVGAAPTDPSALLDPTDAIIGPDQVRAVQVERTTINSDGQVVGTGQTREIAAQLVVRSVGYRGLPLPGVPYDESTGRVPHAEGRVIRDGTFSADEYVTGWIKRGPTGVIGTNKSDAVETVTSLLADVHDGAVRAHGRVGDLDRLLAGRGIHALDMPAWHRIDAAEIELGHSHGRLRTTLAHRQELLAAAEDDH